MTYKEKLLDPRWQRRRLDILNRDNFCCKLCSNDRITLHVHHKEYVNEPWDAPDYLLDTYCSTCHQIISTINKNVKNQRFVSFYGKAYTRCFVMSDFSSAEKFMYVFDVKGKTPSLIVVLEKLDLDEMVKIFNP